MDNIALIVSAFSMFFTAGLYLINRKMFNILYETPIIKWGNMDLYFIHAFGECSINIELVNPSQFNNDVYFQLRTRILRRILIDRIPIKTPTQSDNHLSIAANSIIDITLEPPYGLICQYDNIKLLLTVVDLKGKKRNFPFLLQESQLAG